MEVPSLKDFTELQYKVNQQEVRLDFLEKDVSVINNKLDLIIELLRPHLSPIQIRKLDKRLQK